MSETHFKVDIPLLETDYGKTGARQLDAFASLRKEGICGLATDLDHECIPKYGTMNILRETKDGHIDFSSPRNLTDRQMEISGALSLVLSGGWLKDHLGKDFQVAASADTLEQSAVIIMPHGILLWDFHMILSPMYETDDMLKKYRSCRIALRHDISQHQRLQFTSWCKSFLEGFWEESFQDREAGQLELTFSASEETHA